MTPHGKEFLSSFLLPSYRESEVFSVPEGYQALPSGKHERNALSEQHSSLRPYNESQGSSGYPRWTSQSTWSIWTSASLLAYCLLMTKYKYNIEWFVSLDALMFCTEGASVSVKVSTYVNLLSLHTGRVRPSLENFLKNSVDLHSSVQLDRVAGVPVFAPPSSSCWARSSMTHAWSLSNHNSVLLPGKKRSPTPKKIGFP